VIRTKQFFCLPFFLFRPIDKRFAERSVFDRFVFEKESKRKKNQLSLSCIRKLSDFDFNLLFFLSIIVSILTMSLVFEQLHVEDLVDTGSSFDKQDPALQITIGTNTKITARSV
jgi:hypothetical protein